MTKNLLDVLSATAEELAAIGTGDRGEVMELADDLVDLAEEAARRGFYLNARANGMSDMAARLYTARKIRAVRKALGFTQP